MTLVEKVAISALAFIVVFFMLPFYIRYAQAKGRYGIDKYKVGNIKVAESGGIIILTGLLLSLLLELYLFSELSREILAVIASVLIVALIGVLDDFYTMSWKTKIILPLVASPPLMAIKAGVTTMAIPFVGEVEFGLIYTLVLIPLAITGASNATNMIAGFNGLESGTGIIISAALASIGYITGREIILILSLPLFFALLGFYFYNKYPAKVFPGNIGTYLIGVMIASIVILGNIEVAGIILVGPHIINFVMYFYGYMKRGGERTRKERFGSVTKEGHLVVPHRHYLPFYIASLSKTMTERKATYLLFALQAIFAILAVASVS